MVFRRLGGAGVRRNLRGSRVVEASGFDFTAIPGIQTLYLGNAGKTLIGGEVDVWADQGPSGYDLSAESSAQRPLESLADADLNGQDALQFVSGTADTLEASAFQFNYLHEDECTIFGAWHRTATSLGVLYDSNNANTTLRGVTFLHDVTNGRLIVRVCNGTAALVNITTSNGSVPGGAHHFVFRHRLAGYSLRVDGTEIASGALGASYVSGNSVGPLHVGAQTTNAGFEFGGKVGVLGFVNNYADAAYIETGLAEYAP